MRGFTFLEILITLTIAMNLCALAIPGFKTILGNIHAEMAMSQLYRAIQLTRSEAIKTNSIVTICPSEDGYQCHFDWSKGYIVFIDKNANGEIDPEDQIIHVFNSVKGGGKMIWKNFRHKNYLQMNSLGLTTSQKGTFIYCAKDKNSAFTRALIVNISGRLRVEKNQQYQCQ